MICGSKVGVVYEMTVDGETNTVGPGTIVFLPRGTVHTFKNAGDKPAKMLDWSLPGGQDRYFLEIETVIPLRQRPSMH